MSVRQNWPETRPSKSHFEITLSHGRRHRSLALRPLGFYALFGLVPVLGLVFLAVSLYLIFHDDMVAALLSHDSAQQYAYEDQLTALRMEIVRMTSARSLDQAAYEAKIRDITSRQMQIEQRTAAIAALADRAGLANTTGGATSVAETNPTPAVKSRTASGAPAGNALDQLLALPGGPPLAPPATASAFMPIAPAFPAATPLARSPSEAKPQPQAIELRSDNSNWTSPQQLQTAEAAPIESRLGVVSESLDKIERTQLSDIAVLGTVAQKTAAKLRGVLAETGLETDHLKLPAKVKTDGGVGGPFIPLRPDAGKSPFDRAVLELQDDLLDTDRIQRLLPYLPLRQPLTGQLQVTSPFGTRIDPFFGRLALHPGVDLRQAYGSPVFATAAGRVTIAAPDGGYGNLVEIDHRNGLVTRYGHLSTILVTDGQEVAAGEVVGKLGSTGRSTGPHLHYEVRIDGEPVDPMRFLRAGMKLSADERRSEPQPPGEPARQSTSSTLSGAPPSMRWASVASMKSSRSPSSTSAGDPETWPVRKSLTIW
jgi:murein DD-endopeptidase MepM/ murein hydrolase activator NlpD